MDDDMSTAVLKLDKWGRIYIPSSIRRRLGAGFFEARIEGGELVLRPIKGETARHAGRTLEAYIQGNT